MVVAGDQLRNPLDRCFDDNTPHVQPLKQRIGTHVGSGINTKTGEGKPGFIASAMDCRIMGYHSGSLGPQGESKSEAAPRFPVAIGGTRNKGMGQVMPARLDGKANRKTATQNAVKQVLPVLFQKIAYEA